MSDACTTPKPVESVPSSRPALTGLPRVPRLPRPPRRKLDGLSELLEKRADLRGAYAPADYLEEAIRWSA